MCSKHLIKILVSIKNTAHNAILLDQVLTQAITNSLNHATPTWNCILRGYSKSPTPIKAILIYNHLFINKSSNVPDNYTYPALFKACSCTLSIPKGKEFHARVIKIGLDSDIYVGNALIHFYGRMAILKDARVLFDKMLQRDVGSWNTIMSVYNDGSDSWEVLILFKRLMFEGIKADKITLVILFSACARLEKLDYGKTLHGYATKVGLECMLNLENALLLMYAKCKDMDEAFRLFDEMGSRREIVSLNILINGYIEMESVDLAREVFDKLVDKDIVLWSSMMHGYVKAKKPEEVLELFKKMIDEGLIPDEKIMVSVLSACASLSNLQYGRLVHRFIMQNNITQDAFVKTALVDMYSKCGSLEEALVTFYKTDCKDVVTWTTMIEGLANYGHGNEALCTFYQMERKGIMPNEATFVSVLAACRHSGLITEGCQLFRRMAGVYKIQPTIEHFGCLVDLLSRAGLLHQAEEFVKIVPAEDKFIAYKTLLSACITYSEFHLGEKVANNMMRLGTQSHEAHVLLSNFYALEGQWTEVAEARRNMKELETKKKPGSSIVDLKLE